MSEQRKCVRCNEPCTRATARQIIGSMGSPGWLCNGCDRANFRKAE